MQENEPVVETETSLQESMLERAKKIEQNLNALLELENPDEGTRNQIRVAQGLLASLMARYGIDAAMLAARSASEAEYVDMTLMAEAPFAKKMQDLMYYLADALKIRHVFISNFVAGGGTGRRKDGRKSNRTDYGYRLFGYRPDMERFGILYTISRNIALMEVASVRGVMEFGQDTKRMKDDWLDGFNSGVYAQVTEAERAAVRQAEAEEQDRQERMAAAGVFSAAGTSVALVLADRSKALDLAFDLSNGLTPELKAARKAQSDKFMAEYEQRMAAKRAEQENCPRCEANHRKHPDEERGFCRAHPRPSYGRTYYREMGKYEGSQRGAGYKVGYEANLGTQTGVSNSSGRGAVGR